MSFFLIYLSIILSIFTTQVNANDFHYWKDLDVNSSVNNRLYKIENPARCAIDSQKPSEGVFILINALDIAKSAYRQAIQNNINLNQHVKNAVSTYYQTLNNLSVSILNRMVKGELPILNQETQKSLYRSCKDSDEFCSAAHQKVMMLMMNNASIQDEISKNKKFSISCKHIKNLKLEPGLFNNGLVDETYLNLLASNLYDDQSSNISCDDIDVSLDSKLIENIIFEIKLNGLKHRKFKKIGFEFWNSFKIYLSHAFRSREFLSQYAGSFTRMFNSLHLENSLFLMSNSCKSIERPQCDNATVGDRDLVSITNPDYFKKDTGVSVFSAMPSPLVNKLLTNISSPYDHLHIYQHETSFDWLKHYFDNFSKTAGFIKNKIIELKKNDEIINSEILSKDFIDSLEKELAEANVAFPQCYEFDNEKIYSALWQTYYLCSEVFILNDKDLSPYKKYVADVVGASWETQGLSRDYLSIRAQSYFSMINKLDKFCQKLQHTGFWKDHVVSREHGLSSWFQKIIFEEVRFQSSAKASDFVRGNPLLVNNDFGDEPIHLNVLCYSTAHCLRNYLEKTIDLLIVFNHHSTFLSGNTIAVNNMNNDWADRYQCRTYDPWRKVKRGIRHAAFDIANASLFGLLEIPLYVSGDIKAGEVVSFNQLVEDGRITYTPNKSKRKFEGSLLVNLATFSGIPCSVAIGNVADGANLAYVFTGLSFKSCTSSTKNVINSQGASDLGHSDPRSFSTCFICYLNFESVTNSSLFFLSKVGPWAPFVYLARGFYRMFKEFNDPLHFPRKWKVNSVDLVNTYRRYGNIPKNCVSSLKRGGSCLDTVCLEEVASDIQEDDEFISAHRTLPNNRIEIITNKKNRYIYATEEKDKISCNISRLGDYE